MFLKIKKKVVGSMQPIILLVCSSMKRFKGPVTALLSPTSAASCLPHLLLSQPHTLRLVSSPFLSRPPRFLSHPPVRPTDSHASPPPVNQHPIRLAAVQEVLNLLFTVMSDRKVEKCCDCLIRLALRWGGFWGFGSRRQPGTGSYLFLHHESMNLDNVTRVSR